MVGMQEVILILAILLLVFGPTKLPKIARELGQAWYEFKKASSGVTASSSLSPRRKHLSANNLLMNVARKLDVNTEGKTDEQIRKDILMKINKEEDVHNSEEGR